ncbi:MAG: hypothetical protein OEX12_08510 [Gammaproteobacteria bacterium]|nr:hypothetical protein [Gammaproteobacteria bacterium]
MKRKIILLVAAMISLPMTAPVHAESIVGVDAYGLGSGSTSVYYQMPLAKDRAVRMSLISGADTAIYGFYKMYLSPLRENMRPFVEGGAGFNSAGFAAAVDVGFEIPVSVVMVDPYIGFVAGSGGTGYGIGLNIGYKF